MAGMAWRKRREKRTSNTTEQERRATAIRGHHRIRLCATRCASPRLLRVDSASTRGASPRFNSVRNLSSESCAIWHSRTDGRDTSAQRCGGAAACGTQYIITVAATAAPPLCCAGRLREHHGARGGWHLTSIPSKMNLQCVSNSGHTVGLAISLARRLCALAGGLVGFGASLGVFAHAMCSAIACSCRTLRYLTFSWATVSVRDASMMWPRTGTRLSIVIVKMSVSRAGTAATVVAASDLTPCSSSNGARVSDDPACICGTPASLFGPDSGGATPSASLAAFVAVLKRLPTRCRRGAASQRGTSEATNF